MLLIKPNLGENIKKRQDTKWLKLIIFRDTDTEKQIACEPCSTEDTQVPATHFCKTCDDPEPLCETCAKHHTKQKQSRNHEICRDMREYRINEQNERYLHNLPTSISAVILTFNLVNMILKYRFSPKVVQHNLSQWFKIFESIVIIYDSLYDNDTILFYMIYLMI